MVDCKAPPFFGSAFQFGLKNPLDGKTSTKKFTIKDKAP
jgi:hypothetical protein